jgi:UrcA family protein
MLVRSCFPSTCLAAVLTSSILFAGPAAASIRIDPVVVTGTRSVDQMTRNVGYRDLDLLVASDQRRLDRRVGSAIKDVCAIDDFDTSRTLVSFNNYQVCSNFAWNDARPQISAAIARAKAGFAQNASDTASSEIHVTAGVSE